MNLGQWMNSLADEAGAGTALEALQDIVLLARVQAMGAEHDESPGEYVANASRRFAALAGDEDWLSVMTAMERAEDPARAAMDRMLRWALDKDTKTAAPAGESACGCGGGCHDHA